MYLLTKPTLTNFNRTKVKSHTRKGKKGTYVVREFDRKTKLKNILTSNEVKTGLTFTAGLLGTTVLGALALKGRYKQGIKASAKYVDNRANELVKEFSEYLLDPKKSREIINNGRKVIVQKSRDPFPFARLSDSEAVQKSNFLNMLQQLKTKDTAHFAVGGFDTMGVTSLGISGVVGNPGKLKTNFPDHAFMGFVNDKLQSKIAFPKKDLVVMIPRTQKSVKLATGKVGGAVGLLEKYKEDLSAILGNKYNYHPDGRELAAYALAVEKMYPGKNICFTGQCAGGLVTNYAHDTLNTLRKQKKFNSQIRNMNISSPYFGMHNLPKNEMITVTSTNDFFNKLPSKNKKKITDVVGHSYFTNKDSKDTGYENSKQLLKIQKQFFS